MPHDVTMPQLGMAQDAGKIVSWLKAPGDPVSKGDALLEVETDKAVMEVEAQANGFLTGVRAAAGEDVPVGQIIARISDSAEEEEEAAPAPAPADAAPAAGALPEGHSVTMPQLGMAQDSGILVAWLKSPGDEVAADDVLFEVETDKSTMEVEAGRKGWLAATLAEAGEAVPVGEPVAIISADRPEAPVARSVREAGGAPPAPAPAAPDKPAAVAAKPAAPVQAAPKAPGGRILASPKARRLALEAGLDLSRLVEAGHPQPYHVADLEVLRALPAPAAAATGAAAAVPRRLTARCAGDGLAGFVAWAAETQGMGDADAILAGLGGASLAAEGAVCVAVERFGVARGYSVLPGRDLSRVAASDDAPALILRDLRGTPVTSVTMGAEGVPVLSITTEGAGLSITLECAADQLDGPAAIRLLTEFAGRMEHPLRHLL
jgi:pyruvate dehydrogenase E2 component (dihydrolipoamide acetyltransferase)/2-oxoglutarate dehydrogenase E2 component (dihydrolipoamide succinyltransferase)